MATEPGVTTINVNDIKPGVKFYGLPDANSDGTTDPFTISLAQNESYVFGLQARRTPARRRWPTSTASASRATSS